MLSQSEDSGLVASRFSALQPCVRLDAVGTTTQGDEQGHGKVAVWGLIEQHLLTSVQPVSVCPRSCCRAVSRRSIFLLTFRHP